MCLAQIIKPLTSVNILSTGGFAHDSPSSNRPSSRIQTMQRIGSEGSAPLPTIIIGSGFAGIGMAIALKKAGLDDFLILEKRSDVGGVWRDNTYPGAACDVPSHLYSFSFEPNPNWSRVFAPQAEIHQYLRRCAEKY